MTRYRICPYDLRKWKVQSKWFLWWTDEKVWNEYSYTRTFTSEVEAEKWIDQQIESGESGKRYDKKVADRKRRISPREYP